MQVQPGKAIVTGLGPRLNKPLPAPTATRPLVTTGILNDTISTTPVKVLGGAAEPANRVRKLRLCVVSGANVAYTTVFKGDTAPTITALGAGAATEGILLLNGGGIIETFDVDDTLDLYLVASAAATVIQLLVVEQ